MSAIAHNYKAQGVRGVTDDQRISIFMKGLKRRNQGAQVTRAEPMTPDILTSLRTNTPIMARQVVCHIISDGFWYKMPTRKDGIPHDKGSNSPKRQNEYALDLET